TNFSRGRDPNADILGGSGPEAKRSRSHPVEPPTLRVPGVGVLRLDPAGFAAWLVPAVAIVYLALNNGGYGVVERSELGIAVWWLLLVGTLVGALPIAGGTNAGRALLIVLAAFAAWTALSLTWTESQERTSIELARTITYLAVFAVALAVQREGRWRQLLNGVTTGVAVVCGIAVLSRLEPTWFEERPSGAFIVGIQIESRLAYPLNYASGLGAFAGIALPLCLAAASSARTTIGQGLAAAALPIVALTIWLTASGLSVGLVAVTLAIFFFLAPDRLPKLATLLIGAAGSTLLFLAVEQRDALDRGLTNQAAQQEGDELALLILLVCAGVALAQVGIGLAARHAKRPSWLRVSRQVLTGAAIAIVLVGAPVAVAAGLPAKLSDRWEEFKGEDNSSEDNSGGASNARDSRVNQLLNLSGSGRYQFWEAAVDANEAEPLTGIGPGTFEFWWARNGSYAGFIRDAHSLYMETLGELGIVGFVLIVGFSLAVLIMGAVRCWRAPPDLRLGLAAAVAGCAAFVGGAMVDWTWEIAVFGLVFMVLAAIAVAGGRPDAARRRGGEPPWQRWAGRAAVAVVSLVAIFAIARPLAGTRAIEDSQQDAASGDLQAALAKADDATEIEPYAATPYLQKALVLERLGRPEPAVNAARRATRKESTNWKTWLVLSRLEAEAGNAQAAVDAYLEGRRMNPRSGIFRQ
ncbi:MAG TPA: O-antigen ligase family protein, partial [Solirubrobacterales bacterium]|nr:O-antigen ligase family protein [Solirubrobacterales bacterium]